MQSSILGVVPWREAQDSKFLASLFVERLYGHGAAQVVTCMVLWIALASVFSVLLGYSRVPVFSGAGREFSVGVREGASDEAFSPCVAAGAGRAGVPVERDARFADDDRGNSAVRLIVQLLAGRGIDDVARAGGGRKNFRSRCGCIRFRRC